MALPVLIVCELWVADSAAGEIFMDRSFVPPPVDDAYTSVLTFIVPDAYDLLNDGRSELGVNGGYAAGIPDVISGFSPRADAWRAAQGVAGALLVVGMLLLRPVVATARLAVAAAWAWCAVGVAIVVCGVWTTRPDPDGTVALLNRWPSTAVTILMPLAVVLSGLAARGRPRIALLVVGTLSAAGAVMFGLLWDGALAVGFFERLAVWPGLVTVAVTAVTMYRARHVAPVPGATAGEDIT